MTARRALVEIAGSIQEMPVGDTLVGAGGGAALTYGTATLDFGAFPGSNSASVAVTGQTGISATSHPLAWVGASDSVSTHTAADHRYFARFVGLSCDTPIAATGFTIYARSEHKLQGQWVVRWSWGD